MFCQNILERHLEVDQVIDSRYTNRDRTTLDGSPRAHPSGWTRTQGLNHKDSHTPPSFGMTPVKMWNCPLDEACNVVSAQSNQELNDIYTAIETQEVIDISKAENLINTPTVVTSSHNNKNIKNLQFPRDLYKVQKEAIDAIFAELCTLDKNRATCVLAPRLGKTLIMAYQIAKSYLHNKKCSQQSENDLYVITVPGIKLAKQTAEEIYKNFKKSTFENDVTLNPSIIIVSSGTSVIVSEKKHIKNYSVSKFDEKINPWIKGEENVLKIIITIYDSFDSLLSKFTETGITMNLIADEAHNLTESIKEKKQKTCQLLDDESGTIGKRLFMTGTPVKTKYKNNKIRDKCIDKIYSMDNKKKFGQVVYTANFQAGLDEGILLKPEVVFPKITNIDEYLKHQEKLKGIKLNQSDWFHFTADYFIRCYQESLKSSSPMKKILWYVGNSEKANLQKEILEKKLKDNKLDIIVKAIYTGKVDGKTQKQTSIDDDLKKFIKPCEKPYILINVALINEGITTKECDTILFGEDTYSEQTIVQRSGRATQSDENNPSKICRILIPTVTIDTDENGFQSAGYKVVIRTIKKYLGGNNWCEKYVKTRFNEHESSDVTIEISNDNIDIEENGSEIGNDDDSESERAKEIDDDDTKTLLYEFAENCLKATDRDISLSTLEYISLDKYKELLKERHINTKEEYFDKISNNEFDYKYKELLFRPDKTFKYDWVCWDDLFENEESSPDYKDYTKTRAKVHKLVQEQNITNISEYNNYYKSCENHENNIKNIDNISGIPKSPSTYYQGKNGWIDWGNWLGIDVQMVTLEINSKKSSKKTNELQNLKNITSLIVSCNSRWLNNMENKRNEFQNDKDLCNSIEEISNEISEQYSVNISKYSYNFKLSCYHNDKITLIHLVFYTGEKRYCAYNLEDNGASISSKHTLYEMTNQQEEVSDLKEQAFMTILEKCRKIYSQLLEEKKMELVSQ